MNWLKFILIALGLIVVTMLAFSVIGFVSGALWYLFLFGVVAVGGYIGYKVLIPQKDSPRLDAANPISRIERDEATDAKTLAEYKRKYLAK